MNETGHYFIINGQQIPSYFENKPCNTLLVSEIPENINTIPMIYDHFRVYGIISAISCEGTIAVISYEDETMAKCAFQSPKAFMNNRYIKVDFHPNPLESKSNLAQGVDLDKLIYKISNG